MEMINKCVCIDAEEGIKQIKDESVDLILTDPPYNVDYDQKSKHLSKLGKTGNIDKTDDRNKEFIDKITNYEGICREFYRILKKDTHCYIFCGGRQITKWQDAMIKAGFKPPQILVWKKPNCTFDLTQGHKFPENKEFLLFFHKGWSKLNGYKIERRQFRSCMEFKPSEDTKHHSCAKPQPLLKFIVGLSSKKGDLCLDAFCGSGNHLIAFKQMGREFIGFEISKEYTDNINKRLKLFTSLLKWF